MPDFHHNESPLLQAAVLKNHFLKQIKRRRADAFVICLFDIKRRYNHSLALMLCIIKKLCCIQNRFTASASSAKVCKIPPRAVAHRGIMLSCSIVKTATS